VDRYTVSFIAVAGCRAALYPWHTEPLQ